MPALLRGVRRLVAPKPLEPASIDCGGKPLEVIFRRKDNARRLVLRLNSEGTAAMVTVPRGVSRSQALDFVNRSNDWLETRLEQRGDNIHLKPGSFIPLRGEAYEIRHVNLRRGTVTADPAERVIHVPGELPHMARRITDWCKRAARVELTTASRRYAEAMGGTYRRITIRDQKSRWGSCSVGGDLSYSWRLIFTPPYVLDYVAAHEVAHLIHMNHGRRFWRLVLTHCPDAARAKKWLKLHGHEVHRIVA